MSRLVRHVVADQVCSCENLQNPCAMLVKVKGMIVILTNSGVIWMPGSQSFPSR
jgi:hypothetical protein